MAEIQEWFQNFADNLAKRMPGFSWPDPEESDEYFRVLFHTLVITGASRDQSIADEASMRLALSPPAFFNEVLPELKKHIGAIFRERERSGLGISPDSREGAEAASVGCLDCGGKSGLTSRYRHNPEAISRAVSCYCLCPLGRWIEKITREKSPEVHRQMTDLARHPWLQLGRVAWTEDLDNPHRWPPDAWDFENMCPISLPSFRVVVDNYRAKLLGLTGEPAKQATKEKPLVGIPASLTTHQEIFLHNLGPHWRGKLQLIDAESRSEILDDFRSGIDQTHVVAAVSRIASLAS